MGMASAKSSRRFRRGYGSGWLRRFFPEHSPDGAFGKLPTGATESLSDLLAASETGRVHGVDEMADDIGIASDGRVGTDERAHGFLFGLGRESCSCGGKKYSTPLSVAITDS